MTPQEATTLFSTTIGVHHELLGTLPGGEGDNAAIRTAGGERRVLKWTKGDRSISHRRSSFALTERLRTEADWPVPRVMTCEADGWLLFAQEFMEGVMVEHFTTAMLDEFLPLHAARIGLAASDDLDQWSEDLIQTLTVGADTYCLHEPLRSHDPRTRRVVERAEEIGRMLRPEQVHADDIVHWDLHPGNILGAAGRLSAIVDNDHVRAGDAAFDLLTLAVCALGLSADDEARERLVAIGIDDLDDDRRRAYGAHILVRFLDWPIRKGRLEEIEYWLPLADRLLD